MKEILEYTNLIELYDNLADFSNHNMNKGVQEAHRIIKKELVDGTREREEGRDEYYKGFNAATKKALSILRNRFIPQ